MFSDGTNFWLKEFVNQQNCLIRSEEYYNGCRSTPKKLLFNVVYARNNPPVLLQKRLATMLPWMVPTTSRWFQNFYCPKFQNAKNGSCRYVISASRHSTRNHRPNEERVRLVSRFGPVNCLPRSCPLFGRMWNYLYISISQHRLQPWTCCLRFSGWKARKGAQNCTFEINHLKYSKY